MPLNIFQSSLLLFFFFFFFFFFFPTSALTDNDIRSNCRPSMCGQLRHPIRYPFRTTNQPDYCGHPGMVLNCTQDNNPTIEIKNETYKVIDLDIPDKILKISRSVFSGNICDATYISNATLDFSSIFDYTQADENVTLLYGCTEELDLGGVKKSDCHDDPPVWVYLVKNDTDDDCKVAVVTVLRDSFTSDNLDVDHVLKNGLEVRWTVDQDNNCSKCVDTGGICGYDVTRNNFRCAPPSSSTDPPPSSKKKNWAVVIGICSGVAFICILCLVVFILYRRKRKYGSTKMVTRNLSSHPSSIKDFEKGGIYYGIHLFSYAELEKATNKFDSAKELGDGGFGTVYYGKLRDGRSVAVKRLYENNYKRVEQFMNEVEILTHLRHPNLVSLYGCTSRHSRELLLVYEYIPNGTVADHLHGDRARSGSLPWLTRMKIAVETADALTYLHASDIIHRDVKTNNILLEDNFCVKVADFGLSRLFPMDVTHVSTAPQGTPGYVDPEYHHCYQLTDKSDVYSFGVMLIELISSKPAVDFTRHRHEINLSNMAINKIQNHELHELVDPFLGFESDDNVRSMITAVAEVAFQCLQSVKDMRPSMEEVLEVLKKIQSEDCSKHKAEEMEIPADDIALLK